MLAPVAMYVFEQQHQPLQRLLSKEQCFLRGSPFWGTTVNPRLNHVGNTVLYRRVLPTVPPLRRGDGKRSLGVDYHRDTIVPILYFTLQPNQRLHSANKPCKSWLGRSLSRLSNGLC
jgi:hypothetical protein